jgi:hypothetical protein
MLKDLPDGWRASQEQFLVALRELSSGYRSKPVRVYRGVYQAHINFDKELGRVRDGGLIVDDWPAFDPLDGEHDMTWFSSYGVVDHWTQLPLDLLEKDKRNLLVFLGRHVKVDQPAEGGWRWHKWGPYLGVFQEQVRENEYLYDTPDVVEVWSYQIVEIKEEK